MSQRMAACICVLTCMTVGVGMADTRGEITGFLATRLPARLSVDETEPNGLIQVTVSGEPFVLPDTACLYVAEHMTLRRVHDGFSVLSSVNVPYVHEVPANGRCPAVAEGVYAELGVTLADFKRLQQIVSEINQGRSEGPHFRLLDGVVPPGTWLQVISTTYRVAAAADRHKVIEGLLKGRRGDVWYIDIDALCGQPCLVRLRRTQVLE
jgi:hypothetical protein